MRRLVAAVLALALGGAGCGGDDDGDRSTSAAGTATQPSTALQPGAATQPDTALQPGSGTETTTVPKARAPVTAAQRELERTTARLREELEPKRLCLQKAGYGIAGGSWRSDGDDAPDYQFIMRGHRGHVLVAFYAELARAAQMEPRIRANAKKVEQSAVERRGTTTIVWIKQRPRARALVRTCLFGHVS
ncbi:MAG: hypothetical protein Q8O56_06525 [Solirubrobacteraceae bacterium]|nr:hypothetical protein [Solirubrobacteraceae bacterium]